MRRVAGISPSGGNWAKTDVQANEPEWSLFYQPSTHLHQKTARAATIAHHVERLVFVALLKSNRGHKTAPLQTLSSTCAFGHTPHEHPRMNIPA